MAFYKQIASQIRRIYMHKLCVYTSASSSSSGSIFGDGSDSDVEVSTKIYLARDMYYRNLSITDTGNIDPSGFRIFVSGTLTMANGAIIGRPGEVGNPSSNYGEGGAGQTVGTLGGGDVGGEGAYGPITFPTDGQTGGAPSYSIGGIGGAGGDGGMTSGGLAAGTAFPATDGSSAIGASYSLSIRGTTVLMTSRLYGGGGGSGGGGGDGISYPYIGGGGGGGAGVVMLCANRISAASGSLINLAGGNGGDGEGVDCGGGGGGGGGGFICYTNSPSSSLQWTVELKGGDGGLGFGAGIDGNGGTIGKSFIMTGD